MLLTCKNRIEWSNTVRMFLVEEQTKYERFFVRSSMVLEKRGTISEEENRLFFSSFCMTKRKIFCPFYFYKMGRWRLRKANRHNPKGIKGESETSPFSSNIVIQERSALYYNVIACSIYDFIWSILLCLFCYNDCNRIGRNAYYKINDKGRLTNKRWGILYLSKLLMDQKNVSQI